MTNVITYGTFDTMHWGHINLLRRARALGDRLYVGVSSDRFNNSKGKTSYHTLEERMGFISAIKYVDTSFVEDYWEQKEEDILRYKINVLVMGDDWAGKFDHLNHLCEVVYLPRTDSVSSSIIKSFVK